MIAVKTFALPSLEYFSRSRCANTGFRGTPLLLNALLLLAAAMIASPLAAESIVWSNAEGQPLYEHVIGDSLEISLAGVPANSQFVITLADEGSTEIRAVNVTSDGQGKIPSTLVWLHSGVVGCDANGGDNFPDLAAYRFALYEEAEQILGDRFFKLELRELDSPLGLDTFSLPLITGTESRFYFSDGTGCPRGRLTNDEDVYLSGIHIPAEGISVYTFLISDQDPLDVGSPLHDVRAAYQSAPQQLDFTNDSSPTQLLWTANLSSPDSYSCIIRDIALRTRPFYLLEDQARIKQAKDGLTIDDLQPNPDDPTEENGP